MTHPPDVAKISMSWFAHAKANQSTCQISLKEFCAIIASEQAPHAKNVQSARIKLAAGDKAGYDQIKKQLPGVTISGVFSHRNKEKLIEYTQLLVLDIDGLSKQGHNLVSARRQIERVPTTCVCFVSPGNDGLKVLVKVSSEASHHGFMIKSLLRYYQNITKIKIDGSGKDISRLCFLSYDPSIYTNYESEIYRPAMDVQARIDDARKYVNKRLTPNEGSRNTYVFELACATNKYGLEEEVVANYCCQTFVAEDFSEDEILRTVKNGYRYKKEFGIWQYQAAPSTSKNTAFPTAQLEEARSQLGISDYINDQASVASVLVNELEQYGQDESLVSFFSNNLEDIRSTLSSKATGVVLTAMLRGRPKSLDELIGDRSPNGRLARQLDSILSNSLPEEISERGKRVLVQEYCLQVIEAAFEQKFADSSKVTEANLSEHVDQLRKLEKRHLSLTKDIISSYKITFEAGGQKAPETQL